MTKKTNKVQDEDGVYCISKWTRTYKNSAMLNDKSFTIKHDCILSEMSDGHWEYSDHTTETEDGTGRSMGNDLIITNAETDPEQLKNFQNEPWQKHFVYIEADVVARAFEKQGGSWTGINADQFNETDEE